nr:phosphomannomutase/phosphoglucomutase [Oleiagrimonas sp. C23AA]
MALAGATLLGLLGLFLVWQAWVMMDDAQASQRMRQVGAHAEKVVASYIHDKRSQVQQMLADGVVQQALVSGDEGGRQAAAARARQLLPGVTQVDFYSASLDEVIDAGNYHHFGYAKAAQLIDIQARRHAPQFETTHRGGSRALTLVQPVSSNGQLLGYAWLQWPFAPLQQAFAKVDAGPGRVELREGDGDGWVLAAHGASTAEPGASRKGVPDSDLSIATALPVPFVMAPRPWPLSAVIGLLCLFGAGALLWYRARAPRSTNATEIEEPTLSDVTRQMAAEEAAAKSAAKPAPVAEPAKPAATVSVDRHMFRAYDIRGVVGKTLNAEVARLIGQAIGSLMAESELTEIVVGRDGRLSGPELAGALAEGLRDAGIDVIDIGAAPTPVIYFAAYRFNTGSGVAVTGSHNPPDYNGFKIVVGGQTLSEKAIQDLYERIAENRLHKAETRGGLRQVEVLDDYVDRIAQDVSAERSLKVVVDAGNGIAGAVAPRVLEAIGCEVVPLYCEVDGQFPNHHPDPSDPKNLEDLILSVKQTGADIGVAFDGDGDRLGVVTREGEIIYPDRLLMLFARDVLSRQPGATIIYDVKCTGHLQTEILQAGGSPLMWRTGHSLIKSKMRETEAALAGEMSGHFFFGERWYGFDDGIYSGARLLEILAGDLEGRAPEQIFATLPNGVSTPELKIATEEGENYAFIERFREKAQFEGARLTTIDGLRADWDDGWGLIRASNTTPVLVLRFDADSAAALKRVQKAFREQLKAVDPELKLPF